MLKRQLFTDLLKYLSVFPVVGLIGPRYAGKTVLVKNALKWFSKQSVYLNMEFGPDHTRLSNADVYFESFSDHCIVVDEIQNRSELIKEVRKSVDAHDTDGMFLIASSVISDKLRKHSQLLSGRIGYLTLYPLDRLEVLDKSDVDTHWLRGGFPDSFLASSDNESFVYRDNLIQTLCERDLQQLGLRADPLSLRTFLRMIATNQGQVWNASIYARSMGLSSPTVKKYLENLEKVFLVSLLKPFMPDSKKRLVKAPKVYLADSGLLHSLMEIESINELKNHILIGSSWEGYVVAQIQSILSRRVQIFHYSTHQGAQIDLLIAKSMKPLISIEIQTNNNPILSKGFKIAIKDVNTEMNFIVTPGSANYRLSHNIEVIDLDTLLLKLKEMFITAKG